MRTEDQVFADEFDRKLFDLIDSASKSGDSTYDHEWMSIADALRFVRMKVRRKMHDTDREVTR